MIAGEHLLGITTDLMDCIAAGRGEQTPWAPQGIQENETMIGQYEAWVEFYRSWFGRRNYLLAQAYLNTDRGRVLLPQAYLYGTAAIIQYQNQNVRVLHLLNSSRFLYFFTQPKWTKVLKDEYKRKGESVVQIWRSLEGPNRNEFRLELQQLAQKYSILHSRHPELVRRYPILRSGHSTRGASLKDWTSLSSSRDLDLFIKQWKDLVSVYAERATDKANGTEGSIHELATFGEFLLLDFFDLAYLLQLRKRRHELQAWVKQTSVTTREKARFLLIGDEGDKELFGLLRPTWVRQGLIKNILVFPIASQAFYERETGSDDVFFVAFLAKDWSVTDLQRLRLIVNLMSAASLNELRRLFVVDEARHSAVAAIMGRNMSHNIGSHVLHWLVQNERELAKVNEKMGEGGEEELSRAHFLTYLRERMEYIATVTRSVDWWYSTVSADSLLAPFIDTGEQLESPPFDTLLESIGRSDSVNCVRIEAANADGESRRKAFRRINLAIPYGAAGRQAFYTIIENIVRNAAKHQQKRVANKELVVTLDFREVAKYPDLIEVAIRDSVTLYSRDTVENIETALRDSFTTPLGVPQMRELGLKEMRISAAFLRGIDPSAADEVHFPDLLGVRNENGWLTHVFYVRKSRDVLLIALQADDISKRSRRRLERLGVGIASPEEVVHMVEPYATISSYRFRFLLEQGTFDWQTWSDQSKNPWRWPLRTLQQTSNALVHGAVTADQDMTDRIKRLVGSLQNSGGEDEERAIARNLKAAVYEAWLKFWHGENCNLRLAVYDQPTEWLSKKQEECPKLFIISQNSPFSLGSTEPLPDFSDHITAVFAHHGVPEKMYSALSSHLIYLEGFSGASATAQLLLHPPGLEAEEFILSELRETALTNLLIIDERIAGDKEPSTTTQQRLHCSGIELIGGEFLEMVHRGNTDESGVRVTLPESRWPKLWRRSKKPFMYMTIHYSLIEKSARNLGLDALECAEQLVDFFLDKANFVFIHSGRGRPDLPQRVVRFIDYSSLERWWREGKSRLVTGFGGF